MSMHWMNVCREYVFNCLNKLTALLSPEKQPPVNLKSHNLVKPVSTFVLAGTSVRSPRNSFIYIIKNNIYRVKLSQKRLIQFRKQNNWSLHVTFDLPPNFFAPCLGSGSHESSASFFFKLNKIIFGYFDPENIFVDNENK